MLDLKIFNVLLNGRSTEIGIKDGKIVETGSKIGAEAREYADGLGKLVFPSFIDCHVHLREPGFEYKEDIKSGLAAAACGGVGQVMAMANTKPVNDNAAITSLMLEKAVLNHPDGPFLRPVGALTTGLQGKMLAPMGELVEAGCVAFSNDGCPVENNDLFRKAVEYSSDLGIKVIDHCEDPTFSGQGVMNEGEVSGRLGLNGIPSLAESMQVARDILLASYTDVPIHLAHISCRESVELIYFAKKKGIPVTAETCPHYLLWDDSMVEGYNTLAKVNPPLRTKDDIISLRQALKENVIDILVTDHAPHADFEKEDLFDSAPFGITGLDTSISLFQKLVDAAIFDYSDLVKVYSHRPADIFNLECNSFNVGDPADMVIFDPEFVWDVSENSLVSKGKNTPCIGSKLKGKVMRHYLRGKLIYSLGGY